MFSIESILAETSRTAPYQGGAELWRDPHIAGQMMNAHLAPDTDAASYKPDTIRAICESLPARMGLNAGARVVDLGCGPWLYCHRLAQLSFQMKGIDGPKISSAMRKNCSQKRERLPLRSLILDVQVNARWAGSSRNFK